ncbi:uncharacterized protein LOC128722211 [Anopheles nili]|uniref:uncharacterized protein LOC128722211 n=1 Tax=Anopheles nili TaxID=185578 RepID=UPI00237C1976|nr:uncharacterized protein LOC128722211 [Anopheles nili]
MVLGLVWNYFLIMLLLGILKAALSFYWPLIGEWRYDDLHSTLRYHESCRAKQLLVNSLFFVVYPFVLCVRWCRSSQWTEWTESERDIFELNLDRSRGEEELLRSGLLRGRMIIQKEIVLMDGSEADAPTYRSYDGVDECVVDVEVQPTTKDDCDPLDLSKQSANEKLQKTFTKPTSKQAMAMESHSSNSDGEGDGDETHLIHTSSRSYCACSSSTKMESYK